MGMQPVLMDLEAKGPDPVYMVVTGVSAEEWMNLTIITPGRYGAEFPKTYGHYHSKAVPEVYHRVYGEGLLMLQKKHFDGKMWVPERVDEVLIINTQHGDELTITPEYGHSWSNVGKLPLLLYDNWSVGHEPSDYAMIEKLQGLAYYLIDDGGKVKAVANKKYQDLPEPVWLSVAEFKERGERK